MAITRTAMVDDDGSGTTGTILNNAWKQEFYNQIDALAGGAWVDVPHNAANFTATGGTWTVASQATFAYTVSGKVMHLAVHLVGTTIGGTPTSLNVAVPASLTRAIGQPFSYALAAAGTGWSTTEPGLVKCYRDILGTPWVAGTCHLSGVFVISLV